MAKHISLRQGVLGVVGMVAFAGALAAAQDAPKFDPPSTVVAVLPVINDGAEKDTGFKAGQTKSTSDSLHKVFADRGFKVADDKAVADAMSTLKIDVSDEEQRTRANMISVGGAVNADLVAFVVIDKVAWKSNMGFFTSNKEARAKISIWLIDVKAQKAILDAKPQESKRSGAEVIRNTVKTSDLLMKACAKAVEDALAGTLKPYAVTQPKKSSGN